ncbi:Lipoprotein signal peptidase [Candidatus Hepatincola sp. Av]
MFKWAERLTVPQIRLFFILLIVFLMIDMLSKIAVISNMQLYESIPILPIFSLTLILNKGVSFSFLQGLDYKLILLLSLLAFIVSFLVVASIYKKINKEAIVALALLSAGTLGNWIDRVLNHGVIDFLHVYYQQWHFPIFNLADCMITLSTILIIKSFFISKKVKGN